MPRRFDTHYSLRLRSERCQGMALTSGPDNASTPSSAANTPTQLLTQRSPARPHHRYNR